MVKNDVDPAPVEDSTDSDSHCERALCLSSQEGHGGQSTDHDCMDKTHKIHTLQQPWWIYGHKRRGPSPRGPSSMWTQLLWRTARTLTLIARGHCACHPRKAMVASPQTMIAWIKPTKSTRYSSRGGFTATDRGPMGSHRSTGYSSPGGRRQITHKIHTLQQPWWIYGHRPWTYRL